MSGDVVLNGVPTEDAALGYALPPGSTVHGQTWQVSPDGTDWTDIPGAHGATFTPGDAEAGKLLRVLVNFDDAALNQRHEASDGRRVANVDDEPRGSLAILGEAVQGATLALADAVTDGDGMSDPGRDYEWQVQGENGDWTTLPGGRGAAFTLTQAEVGRAVRAVMSYVDDHGSREWVVAGPTAAVANANDAPRGGVAVAGTAKQGEALSLVDTVTDADGWPGFAGATGLFAEADPPGVSFYTDPDPVELGIRFTAASAGAITGLRFYKAPGGTSPHVGNLWTSAGELLATAAFVGETVSGWQKVDFAAPIGLAAGASYVASYHSEAGGTYAYTPHFFDAAHSNGPLTAPAGANGVFAYGPGGFPTDTHRNENYWVDVAFDPRPRAAGAGGFEGFGGAPFGYQWQVEGENGAWADIAGATGASFAPTEAEVGRSVRAVFRYTDGQGTAEAVASAATAPVENANDAPTGGLAVGGDLRQGATLAVVDGVDDADGAPAGARAYHWHRETDGGGWMDIPGATDASHSLTEADVGRRVQAVLIYTDAHGNAERVETAATAPVENANDPPGGTLRIVGAARQGAALSLADAVTDADGMLNAVREHQWQVRDEAGNWIDIPGATAATFAPTQAEVGRAVRALMGYQDDHGTAQWVAARPSSPIENANDAPQGAVVLAGRPARGEAVAASVSSLADADGMGAVFLHWERKDGDTWTVLPGATGPDYAPGAADVGHALRAVATWTDGHGTPETAHAETGAVAPRAIALPPPEDGETERDAAADEWTSADLGGMIADGGAFAPPPGAESVRLADGVLSFGAGTTEAFVARLYLGLLGREGDVEGLAAFAERDTESGASRADLARMVLSSAEYGARHGAPRTDAEFVEDLYAAFLGRGGDAAERGFWTAALESGVSRAEVAAGVAGSTEACAHMQGATAGVFVADVEAIQARSLYRCALGREADAAGLRHLSDALDRSADARTIGDGFERSAEFQARHGGGTDEAFVDSLYRDGLGRQADAAGLGHWAGLLESGRMGRGELALHFAATEEARGHLDWPL